MTTTKNNEHKKLNVPNLRFPEFQGEWENCKLGDYGKVVTGNTPPTKDVENYENGTFLWASPADLGTINAQWKFSGDKHKSLQVDTERTFHQRCPLVML